MAGNRKIDVLCAQYVMGLVRTPDPDTEYFVCPELWDWNSGEVGGECPAYSSDPIASEALLEKMRSDGWSYVMATRQVFENDPFWCRFMRDGKQFSAFAITQKLAICLAALRAYGVPESEIQEAMRG